MSRRVRSIIVVMTAAVVACRTRQPAGTDASKSAATGAATASAPSAESRPTLAAKRVAPPDVAPVSVGSLTFAVIPWGKERGLGQNGGYIAAKSADGRELWTLKIYDVRYDPKLEEDVQDIFIDTMTAGPGPNELTIKDERGRKYRVDIQKRRVTAIP